MKTKKADVPVLTVTRRVFTHADGSVGVSSERPAEVAKLAKGLVSGSSVGLSQSDTLAVLQWELEQAGGGLKSLAGVIAGGMRATKFGSIEPDHNARLKAGEMAGRVFRVLGSESNKVVAGEGEGQGDVTGYVEVTATTTDAELLAGVLGDNVKRRFGGDGNSVSLEEASEAVSLIGGFEDSQYEVVGDGIVEDLDVSEPIKGLDRLGEEVVVLHKAGVKSKGLARKQS